ncbi:MAG: single-stranded DNA-binding protein [Pacificimonas sp.]
MSTNIAIVVGRLGQDPEVRETKGETTITTLSVATDRPSYKDGKTYKNDNGYTAMDTSWHRVTVFNGLGKTCAKYAKKGMIVTVNGRIQYSKYTDKDGIERWSTEIIADSVDFNTRVESNPNADADPID